MIGILSIQGGFAKHQQMVRNLGFDTLLVKTASDLQRVDKLIMPGGESTAMRLLLKKHQLWEDLKLFCQTKPVFGTCAGAILLAKTITSNAINSEDSFGTIDLEIARNRYGRQIDSFEATLNVNLDSEKLSVPAIFIRAPQIIKTGPRVKVLATYNEMPVLVQEGLVLAATFHPELTSDTTICHYFLTM